jgi:hypothetical protein
MTPDRVYRLLLTLYPKAFRREYGDAMVETFQDLRRESDLRPFAFWLFVVTDACVAASSQQIEAWRSRPRRLAVQWMTACALGATMCGVLGSAVTWAFSYLYHPYLEGAALVPWTYGAMLGTGLSIVQSAVLRRLRLGMPWILVSAACAALGLEMAIAVANLTGPLGYGFVFGGVVAGGQWLVLRGKVRGAGLWVLPSSVALSAVVLLCSTTLSRVLAGMNPLSQDMSVFHTVSEGRDVALLLRGLYAPASWSEFTLGFAIMAATGVIVGAVTAKSVSSMLSEAR